MVAISARLDQARSALAGGDSNLALRCLAELLRGPAEPRQLVEAAECTVSVDPVLAEKLARRALQMEPAGPRATHLLAIALARQGQHRQAERLFRSALAMDGRLADALADDEPEGAWIGRFEPVPCPSCDESDAHPVWVGNISLSARTHGRIDPLRVWASCEGCGLVRVVAPPTPAALAGWREVAAPPTEPPPGVEAISEVLHSHDMVIERIRQTGHGVGWVSRGVERPRLIEVGATWGTFQAAADWRGFETRGLLQGEAGAAWTRERFHVLASAGSVPGDLPDGPFDVIAMWEQVDRLLDPLGTLMSLSNRLDAGGIVALSTPSLDHPAHRAQGYDDALWSDPERRVWFDRETLAVMMLHAGLQPVAAFYDDRRIGSIVVLAVRDER